MRKTLLFISFLLTLGLFSSCTIQNNIKEEKNKENIIVSVINNTDFDLYGIELSIKEDVIGSLISEKSGLQKEAIVSFYLYNSEDYTLSNKVDFTISLINKEGALIPLEMTTFELTEKQEYIFVINGKSMNEASLKKIE